jgi:membrane peptidoglycan carboxypeptidase
MLTDSTLPDGGLRRPGRDDETEASQIGLSSRPRKSFIARFAYWTALAATLSLLGYAASLEASQSYLQSVIVSRAVKDMGFTTVKGPSLAIRFPHDGPYDRRLGYVQLPSFIQRLTARNFVVEWQAQQSPALVKFLEAGGYAVYREKSQAGLVLRDRSAAPLEAARYPEFAYGDFSGIPAILVNTLRFIEDRALLDADHPYRNPAVEWRRFMLAAGGWAAGAFDPDLKRGGASTLATQIEKYRHSPAGRTEGAVEKLRQMASATARAYLNGPETIPAQKAILTAYLDSTPLGSRPGYGEIIGLGDGLLAWYGTDFAAANRILSRADPSGAEAVRRAQIYKQALSLLIAQRRPSFYLNAGRGNLERLTDAYLRALAAAGVIDQALATAAMPLSLQFSPDPPGRPSASFVERKAVDAVRTELMTALDLPNLYTLDRLDLSADVSIDGVAQSGVAALLERLKDAEVVKALGLIGDHLLGDADPGKIAWSVVVYECGNDRNLVRVHADSLNQPFDINSGAKLILGSTAKLRTLATYLGIVDGLHRELSGLDSRALRQAAAKTSDPLRRWAAEYLAALNPRDRALQTMLDAAMQRHYSANPGETFFTGGGEQVFRNFERSEDYETPTVEQAFDHSINLAFVRLLRDIIHHYEAESGAGEEILKDSESPEREAYLRRFADQEGGTYVGRFHAEYAGLSPQEALDRLASHVRPVPRRLAVVFRSVRPNASVADLESFLARRLPGVATDEAVADLYAKYAPEKFSLNDRGYLAGVNPLELWLAAYLQQHSDATRAQIVAASAGPRQEAYAWLFKTRNLRKQDVRIRTLIEEDAFNRLLQEWKRQGYPFGRLVPSLATAIGSSGDRPDALATLMGIILNGGLKQPTTDIERVHFAAGTPYDTEMGYRPKAAERVMSPAVAATLRRALAGVVEKGTATRLRGAYVRPDGARLPIGGKTGTGDNRFETFAPGHRLIEDRAVDRTATFVFFLGDRLYGTVTAYVSGEEADNYHFTSALSVSLLKALAPKLGPLLASAAAAGPVEGAVVSVPVSRPPQVAGTRQP